MHPSIHPSIHTGRSWVERKGWSAREKDFQRNPLPQLPAPDHPRRWRCRALAVCSRTGQRSSLPGWEGRTTETHTAPSAVLEQPGRGLRLPSGEVRPAPSAGRRGSWVVTSGSRARTSVSRCLARPSWPGAVPLGSLPRRVGGPGHGGRGPGKRSTPRLCPWPAAGTGRPGAPGECGVAGKQAGP
jgi:hypothetical protein